MYSEIVLVTRSSEGYFLAGSKVTKFCSDKSALKMGLILILRLAGRLFLVWPLEVYRSIAIRFIDLPTFIENTSAQDWAWRMRDCWQIFILHEMDYFSLRCP